MHRDTPQHDVRSRFARHVAMNGRWRPALLAAVLVPTLAACGVVGGMIGPVDVEDPLAVDGHVVHASFEEGSLAPAAAAHGGEAGTFTVDDMEIDLRGFSVGDLHIDAGFEPDVRLTGGPMAAAPDSFTVTAVDFEATLDDAGHDRVTFTKRVELDGVTFAKGAACDGPESCTYTYDGTASLTGVLQLDWNDLTDLAHFVAILREAPEPNEGTLTVDVEVDSDPSLAGYSAEFTMVSSGTSIELQ